jgi:hypothetical protein
MVATLPFAHNTATRYISPTKIPEYLAAGKAVVSTSPTRPTPLSRPSSALGEDPARRLREGDAVLSRLSWDWTWAEMDSLIGGADAVCGGAGGASAATGEASADDVRDLAWPVRCGGQTTRLAPARHPRGGAVS